MSTAADALTTYLNDHVGGASAGLAMFRRAARAQRDQPAGPELARLTEQVAQDRAALLGTLRLLGVRPRRYKVYGGWLLEKAGRLKPNGRVVRRAPLSDLLELEALLLGVAGKGAGWRSLRALADTDPRLDRDRLDELVQRARDQADTLEELRIAAAAAVLATGRRPADPA